MKWIAISLNVLLIAMIAFLLVTEGGPNKTSEYLGIALVLAAPIASLIALWHLDGNNWIGLYFKRKALEEKQKIKKLGGEK